MEAIFQLLLSSALPYLALGVIALLFWLLGRYMSARSRNLGAVLAILGGALVVVLVLWGLGVEGL